MFGPIARIILRYAVGLVAGMHVGELLAGDPDVVMIVAAGLGVAVEAAYAFAKRTGGAT